MPIYDFVCEACGHRWEAFHGLNESGPHQCPVCAAGPVKRVFAPPTIVFKGSGWAKTDRRYSGAPQKRKDAEGSGSGSSESSRSGESAAKGESATKAEPTPDSKSGGAAAPASD